MVLRIASRGKGEGTIRNLNFKPGRDVFGTGGNSGPYYFRPELFYHTAFSAFLEHQEIRNFKRSPWLFRDKTAYGHTAGDRVETQDGRVLYFWNRYPHFKI
jgi:hypothetical protein